MKKLLKKIVCIIILIGMFIISFLGFTKYYYKSITFSTLLKSFIVFSNCVLNYTIKFLKILVYNFFTANNIKIALIIVAIIYVIDKYELISLINNISSFQFKDFKVETNKVKDIKNSEQEKLDKLKNKDEKDEKKINESKNRLKLIEIMIDEPYIVEIISKFLNKRMKSLTIPWSEFKDKTSISSIGKIFDYEIKADSIKIKKIKNNIKDELAQVYSELINNGVIYRRC